MRYIKSTNLIRTQFVVPTHFVVLTPKRMSVYRRGCLLMVCFVLFFFFLFFFNQWCGLLIYFNLIDGVDRSCWEQPASFTNVCWSAPWAVQWNSSTQLASVSSSIVSLPTSMKVRTESLLNWMPAFFLKNLKKKIQLMFICLPFKHHRIPSRVIYSSFFFSFFPSSRCSPSLQLWVVHAEHLSGGLCAGHGLLRLSLGPAGGAAAGCCLRGAGRHVRTRHAAAEVCGQHHALALPVPPGHLHGRHGHHPRLWPDPALL